jgi:hypothetical protein
MESLDNAQRQGNQIGQQTAESLAQVDTKLGEQGETLDTVEGVLTGVKTTLDRHATEARTAIDAIPQQAKILDAMKAKVESIDQSVARLPGELGNVLTEQMQAILVKLDHIDQDIRQVKADIVVALKAVPDSAPNGGADVGASDLVKSSEGAAA